nr:MAG TPA: hypothetical protein [Bacteriophage sp.]
MLNCCVEICRIIDIFLHSFPHFLKSYPQFFRLFIAYFSNW